MSAERITFESIGSVWEIDLPEIGTEKCLQISTSIQKMLSQFDTDYSRFRSNSKVADMAKHAGTYNLSNDATILLTFYKKLYDVTHGAFTPMIGSVLESAGYDADYSFREKEVLTPHTWDEALALHGDTLTVHTPVLLDFGGLGKGYMVDTIANFLLQKKINEFCINAGGDIFYHTRTDEEMSVGLEHPDDPKQVIGIARIRNNSICASAGNRRKWGKYHHIIDPRTLASPSDILATWVVAKTALTADALATCLFLVPPSVLLSQFSFEYCIVKKDYSVASSKGFPVQFF